MLALVTVAAGLFFKVAAVPFHQWAPDVYEGAPTPITAYVSVASKTASFALLLRLFLYAFWPVRVDWIEIIAGVAIASLTLGNFAAITQTNVKRLLAYSSISHVGYILLGMVAALERPGWERDRHEGHRVLPVRVRLHDHRRVRRDHRAAAAGNDRRRTRRPERADRAQPRVGRACC